MRSRAGCVAGRLIGLLGLLLSLLLPVGRIPASANPGHPNPSLNVAVIGSTASLNGGSFPTTTSGPTGNFATEFNFFTIPVANLTAASLAAGGACGAQRCDTVLLNIASPAPTGLGCNVASLSAAQRTAIVNHLLANGKLFISDSECPPQDYSFLPTPFTTSNPGALGATGTVTIAEDSILASSIGSDSHFIDAQALGQYTDAVGDMNVLTTRDPSLCLAMTGTNALNQSGPTLVYGKVGTGVLVYQGFDIDVMYSGTSPTAGTGAGDLAKIWLQVLQAPLNGDGLPCQQPVVPQLCGGTPTIVGTEGPDKIVGTAGNDVIDGKGGDDQIAGGDGNDVLIGGDGNDYLSGGNGDDELCGGNGDDQLSGGAGDDKLDGNTGNDRLSGGSGNDQLSDAVGIDGLSGGDGDDSLNTRDEAGGDSMDGGPGTDRCTGDSGDVVLNCP